MRAPYREMIFHLFIWIVGTMLACGLVYKHTHGDSLPIWHLYALILLPAAGCLCYCIASFRTKAKLDAEIARRQRDDELMDFKPRIGGLRHPVPPDGF